MRFSACEDPVFPKLPGVDPMSLRVFHSLFKTMRLYRQLMFKMMSEKEAHPGQAGCLLIVSNHAGITQRDLARKLHVASSTVTVMLQKMEAAGIIVRKTDVEDQRLTRLYLTDAGRILLDEMNEVLARFINISFGQMSSSDREDFDRLLNTLCTNISEELDGTT
ncbi:MAG: MarR family transcriptional regulator [Firmicutes bacterium]|nr:MarR family transcriptional regulator [Bacillota bacterium]